MLLTPLMARFFIRQGLVDHAQADSGTDRKLTPLDHMQRYYNKIITWACRTRSWFGVERAGGCSRSRDSANGAATAVPLAERNQFVMDVWLPEGTKIETTDATVRRIENGSAPGTAHQVIRQLPGASAPRFYYNVNPQLPAAIMRRFWSTQEGEGKPQLVAELRHGADVAPEAKVFVKELQQGKFWRPVEVRISGDDIAHSKRWATKPRKSCGIRRERRTFTPTGMRTPGRWA